ncbi:MAG: CinA family protein [Alistipes sp.]
MERIIPYGIVGYGDASLESVTGDLLRARGATVATAESCTGGNIARRFTALPGASDYFRGGVVAYSNDVKRSLLGVDGGDLERFGAVSRPVAEQMAEGVRRATGSVYGIATTGVAGPSGGTPDKPVGTVWMAVSGPEGTFSLRMTFGSLRSQNIERARRTRSTCSAFACAERLITDSVRFGTELSPRQFRPFRPTATLR